MNETLTPPKTDAQIVAVNMLLITQMRHRGMYGLGSRRTTKDVTPQDGEGWARECNPMLARELFNCDC